MLAGRAGSLTVVGTGIQLAVQATPEARDAIQRADEVLYLADPATGVWIQSLKPAARSLQPHYRPGVVRREIYAAIVEEIMAPVRRGADVCAAFYGHPGVLVRPAHEAIRRARAEGFGARMLPAVSAEDCLFADLGVDPGQTGCQSYEATDFLVHRRTPDTSAALILWQISVVGSARYSPTADYAHLPVLIEYLGRFYDPEQETILYEASPFPMCDHVARRVLLSRVVAADLAPMTTMYIPPAAEPKPDEEMLERLGMTQASTGR